MDQLDSTFWFNRDILMQMPSVRCGVCVQDTGEDELLFNLRIKLFFIYFPCCLVYMMYY